ncbi:MAG: 30S ribosomal protein S3 [Candidatus Brocadiia bacterium]|nr:30S ribosomal protein S3 [Planctomycetota bacterium]
MGQKLRPTSLRLGITENWKSRWYAEKEKFGDYLVEDERIRRLIKKDYYYAGISKIEIERTRDEINLIVHCARPGLLIGRKGVEVERLKGDLQDLTSGTVEISVQEVSQPELNAQLVAEEVAQQLERRSSFRRTLKQTADVTMEAGAEGARIEISGRLGGSEIARSVHEIRGSLPLHTLIAKIDYGFTEASTKYGSIGVKVWINTGRLTPGQKMPEEQENG